MSDSLILRLNELEIRCITGDFKNFDFSSTLDELKSCLNSNSSLTCAFETIVTRIINHEYARVLDVSLSEIGLLYKSDDRLLHFEECNEAEGLLTYIKQLVLLFVGVSALQEFVRANICGPCREEDGVCSVFAEPLEFCSASESVRQYLCRDGEFPLSNVTLPNLLFLSEVCLSSSLPNEPSLTRKWWLMRCLLLHQQVLPERIASIYDQIVVLLNSTASMEWIQEEKHRSHLVLFYIECEQMYLYYQRVNSARKFLSDARDLVGLSVELSGAYGKRTQFQQKPTPQLFVKLQRIAENGETGSAENDTSDFPPDLQLQDDTLLNTVSFLDGEQNSVQNLLPEEQIVLLGECSFLKRSSAADELQQEEMLSYVHCMLQQNKVWSIYAMALVLRCRLQKSSSRHMDRTLRQLEALIECIRKENPAFHVRLPMLYAVPFPTVWSLEKALADLLMAMGAVKTALDVYKRLDLWEDIVLCYQRLGRTAMAVEVIEERLKSEETPLLYCLLGDVTDDPKMYEKASSLSAVPNARSQRSLGYYHYKRKDYLQCIPYFEKSVEINYLQASVWFALGFAALQCEKYDLAARAYRQVVSLDSDNFQAWNNLSHAYIKSNQKSRAFSSLQEALKCNYEEWRVWENFLLVCVDIGAFENAIRAYHRLIDIKGKYADVEVLEILVKAINQNVLDFEESPASRLKNSLQQLFGRVTSVVRKEYKIWELYSRLLCPDPDSATDVETLDKAVGFQQQATVCCSNSDSWSSDVAAFRTVLQTCQRHIQLSSSLVRLLEEHKLKAEKKALVKVMTKRILTRAENGLINFQDSDRTELEKLLNSLKSVYNEILEL